MKNLKNFALLFALTFCAVVGVAATVPNVYHVVYTITLAPDTDADGTGGYMAAQYGVREVLAKGQHLTLRLNNKSHVFVSPRFWYDFLGESGDLWELDKDERQQRIYSVLAHVHLKSNDAAYTARVHRALEKGAAMWMAQAELEPLAAEDRD